MTETDNFATIQDILQRCKQEYGDDHVSTIRMTKIVEYWSTQTSRPPPVFSNSLDSQVQECYSDWVRSVCEDDPNPSGLMPAVLQMLTSQLNAVRRVSEDGNLGKPALCIIAAHVNELAEDIRNMIRKS